MIRRSIVLVSTALITAVLAGCGNTASWVDAQAASGWPAQYGDARNSSYEPAAGADTLRLEWVRSVKGDLAAAVALGSGSYPGRQRADARGLLADGVGGRQPGPPTLVHPTGAGRRYVQSPFRRVRQPLHRPARHHDLVPVDAVDPLASTGDRDADDAKASWHRTNSWW